MPFGQKLFAKLISSRRVPKVAEEYKLIGGRSPINEWTEKQRSMLEVSLRNNNESVDVYTAMRYWNPLTKEVAANVESKNYDKIILLPLYPHYSITTTGSSFNEWNRHYKSNRFKLIFVNDYYLHPKYLEAINQRIDETILRFPEKIRNEIQIVFSLHGTPISLVKKGDPYCKHIKQTVEAVMKLRKHSHNHHLCFQSKVGPMKWLEPATSTMIEELSSSKQEKFNDRTDQFRIRSC